MKLIAASLACPLGMVDQRPSNDCGDDHDAHAQELHLRFHSFVLFLLSEHMAQRGG